MEKRDSGLISAFKALSIDVEIYLCKGGGRDSYRGVFLYRGGWGTDTLVKTNLGGRGVKLFYKMKYCLSGT